MKCKRYLLWVTLFLFLPAHLSFASSPSNQGHKAGLSQEKLVHEARALLEILEVLQAKEELETADQVFFNRYGHFFGGLEKAPLTYEIRGSNHEHPIIERRIGSAFCIERLKRLDPASRFAVLERLRLCLRARLAASLYCPKRIVINGCTYFVHNNWVQLLGSYNSKEIDNLLTQLSQKKIFELYTDPNTGLVRPAETCNDLKKRQWFTDNSKTGLMQKVKDPLAWKKVVVVHAAALSTPTALEAIEKSVKDLTWYRVISEDPIQEKIDGKKGIFHAFDPTSIRFDSRTLAPVPDEIKPDAELNRKRVESFALLLADFVDTLRVGFVKVPSAHESAFYGKQEMEIRSWGFQEDFLDSKHSFDLVAAAIVNLTRFLMAINTNPVTGTFDMAAPSSSSWEEMTFTGGMSSDIALAVCAFEKLSDLLFNPQYDASSCIRRIRRHLLEKFHAEAVDKKKIEAFIAAGRVAVDERIIRPLALHQIPIQHPDRKADTSLLLLAASDYLFDSKDLVHDAQIRLGLVLAMKEALLEENGMRRYNEFEFKGVKIFDSYLNDDFHMPDSLRAAIIGQASRFSGKSSYAASQLQALQERQQLCLPKHAAQWCLGVSASLQALSKAKLELLHETKARGDKSGLVQDLLKTINNEINDFINRNIALIAGEIDSHQLTVRSDGSNLVLNSVMECYEVVRDLKGIPRWLPGAHTHAWGASQLFDGLNLAKMAALLEEEDHKL